MRFVRCLYWVYAEYMAGAVHYTTMYAGRPLCRVLGSGHSHVSVSGSTVDTAVHNTPKMDA